MKLYFSDVFGISEDCLEEYGAFNISMITDLPLFVDPFLLFNRKKPRQKKHQTKKHLFHYLKLFLA